MRLCKDCRHFQPWRTVEDDGNCCHQDVIWIHPVSGNTRTPSAFLQRSYGNKCGPTGALYEPVPAAPPSIEEQEDLG